MSLATLLLVVSLLAVPPADAQTQPGRIQGKVRDGSGLPLPGVVVTLTRVDKPPLVVHTDEIGRFTFDVPSGRYALTAELAGFQTAVRPDVMAGTDPVTLDIVLELGKFTEETQVVARAPRVFTASEPTAPATVDQEIIKIAPVQGLRYDSALPLLPGTVRGPDGLISISGSRSWQGTVLADGLRESDPVSGEAVLSLPISAIANTQVYSPLPPAEAGPATGGVTLVNTKPAVDTFAFSVQGLLPRPRLDIDGGVALEAWHPTFGLSGALVKGRVWLAEAVEYRWERFQTTTVVGKQDTSLSGWTSFTRLDMKPRGSHHVTLRLIVTPDSSSHYGLGAFEPADTVPDLKTTGVSVAVTDRVALGDRSTLDSYVHVKRVQLEMTSGGSLPYVIGHERVAGNYFKNLNQTASRVEVGRDAGDGRREMARRAPDQGRGSGRVHGRHRCRGQPAGRLHQKQRHAGAPLRVLGARRVRCLTGGRRTLRAGHLGAARRSQGGPGGTVGRQHGRQRAGALAARRRELRPAAQLDEGVERSRRLRRQGAAGRARLPRTARRGARCCTTNPASNSSRRACSRTGQKVRSVPPIRSSGTSSSTRR